VGTPEIRSPDSQKPTKTAAAIGANPPGNSRNNKTWAWSGGDHGVEPVEMGYGWGGRSSDYGGGLLQ